MLQLVSGAHRQTMRLDGVTLLLSQRVLRFPVTEPARLSALRPVRMAMPYGCQGIQRTDGPHQSPNATKALLAAA